MRRRLIPTLSALGWAKARFDRVSDSPSPRTDHSTRGFQFEPVQTTLASRPAPSPYLPWTVLIQKAVDPAN